MILVYKTNKGRELEVDADELRIQGRGGTGKHTVRFHKGEHVVGVILKE